MVSARRQYYETSDFATVAADLVRRHVLEELVRLENAPATEDSPGHYFAFLVA